MLQLDVVAHGVGVRAQHLGEMLGVRAELLVQDGHGYENIERFVTPGPGFTSEESVSNAKYSAPVAVAWIRRSASGCVTATVTTIVCPPALAPAAPFVASDWLEVDPSVKKAPVASTSTRGNSTRVVF